MKSCINIIRLPLLLNKFEIQKCGQILCAHKPCFLMPGHIYIYVGYHYNGRSRNFHRTTDKLKLYFEGFIFILVGLGDTENVPCDNCNKKQCDYCNDIAVEYLLQ